jgi:putative hydrolase of HD superfamily
MKKNNLSNFLFEAGTLKRLQRTGWQILGGNSESIAEHSYMVGVIGYVLAKLEGADVKRVLIMSLFHDFEEARIGDIYKLADLYVNADKNKAIGDFVKNSPDDSELLQVVKEYEKSETLESKIVHDADTLSLCLELKVMVEGGNTNAKEWLEGNFKRLKLDLSKKLLSEIVKGNSQDWWKKERDKIHKNY